jgi:hypothetical protein
LIKPHNMKEIIKTVENMLRYCDWFPTDYADSSMF